jgi:hypothetical protein
VAAEDREEIVANQGWDAWKREKDRRTKARERADAAFRQRRKEAAARTERLRARGKSEAGIAKLVHEPLEKAEVAAFEGEVVGVANKAVDTLVEMWRIYVRSFRRGRTAGGARVGAETEGTPGTVAAHGFLNMPSRLVAAMSGSDAGDLQWLGATTVRDFMHFELKAAQRPSLRG